MGKRPYPSFYTSFQGEAGDQVCGFIQRTSKTLDCMVYSITHEGIVNELVEAHQRGVKVRIVTDKVQAAGSYSRDEELRAAGIEVREDAKAGSMHHKVAISDKGVSGAYAVLVGSFNWTKNADERNAESAAILRTSAEVEKAQEEFERVWVTSIVPEVT